MEKKSESFVSPIIAKINAKSQVLDFRDNLNPANVTDYAMIHGVGGANHARVSCIGLQACDYSAGTGEGLSKSVKVNIDVDVARKLYEVAKVFVAMRPMLPKPEITPSYMTMGAEGVKAAKNIFTDMSKVGPMLKAIIEADEPVDKQDLVPVLDAIRNAKNNAKTAFGAVQVVPETQVVPQAEVIHEQSKINTYAKPSQDGKYPVSKLVITHMPYTKDGQPRRYAWFVSITNGVALEKKQGLGGTSYDSSSFVVSAEVTISASDDDFLRAMSAVVSYVDAWEKTFGLPLISQAKALMEENLKQRNTNARD